MIQKTISNHQKISIFHRMFRSLISKRCKSIRNGLLRVADSLGEMSFGDPDSELVVSLEIHNPRFYRRVVTEGDLGVARSLIDGDLTCSDLTLLVKLFIRNLDLTDRLEQPGARLLRQFKRFGHWLRRNTIQRSRKNIEAHYDLGNEFYSLWLDSTMNYSSGIFTKTGESMQSASIEKMNRLCQRLQLKPTDHLLEIGTGWGALACFAAEHYGCRVTTTTISQQQFEKANQRVQQRQLEDRVTVLNQDYRLLEGQYDKIVSVEMIEAVGHQFYDGFFQKCGELLTPQGLMMMQAIVIADHRYESHINNVDFISQYIFPGGSLPSISRLTQVASSAAQMRMLELVDITPHYAETLRRWRDQFNNQIPALRALGFDNHFIRMWNYYLCYCEAGFEERQINTVQFMLAKPACRMDPLIESGEPSQTQTGTRKLQLMNSHGRQKVGIC